MKRFVGLVVALSLVPAGTAAATGWGSNDLKIVDNPLFTLVDGPGFTVGLTQFGLYTHIDERPLRHPRGRLPDRARASQTVPTAVRPIVCENGTYRLVDLDHVQDGRARLGHGPAARCRTRPPSPTASRTSSPSSGRSTGP